MQTLISTCTLDPQVQVLFDQMAASDAAQPRNWAERRAAYLAAKPFAGPPESISIEPIEIPSPWGQMSSRLYRPILTTEPQPAIVFFHGGSFVMGDLESRDTPLRAFANRSGCVVISVEYRLAPENPYPAAVQDTLAATEWVGSHTAELGIDPERLAVGGDSAGGNLAAVVAKHLAGKGPRLRFQLLIYPMTDAKMSTSSWNEFANNPIIPKEQVAASYHAYAGSSDGTDRRLDREVTIVNAELPASLPDAIVITGGCDPLRDEGHAYADQLRRAGTPTQGLFYPGLPHGFFQMGGVVDAAKTALNEIGDLFRERMTAAGLRVV